MFFNTELKDKIALVRNTFLPFFASTNNLRTKRVSTCEPIKPFLSRFFVCLHPGHPSRVRREEERGREKKGGKTDLMEERKVSKELSCQNVPILEML